MSPGSCSARAQPGSGPATTATLVLVSSAELEPGRASVGVGDKEPQQGMLVTELTRDAFPLGVVRVEVTSLGSGGVHSHPVPSQEELVLP